MVSRGNSSTQSRAASFQIMSWSSTGKRGKGGKVREEGLKLGMLMCRFRKSTFVSYEAVFCSFVRLIATGDWLVVLRDIGWMSSEDIVEVEGCGEEES